MLSGESSSGGWVMPKGTTTAQDINSTKQQLQQQQQHY
jgi:hypothetical protein